MKQWMINLVLLILSILAILFSLLKVTPFEIIGDTYIGTIVSLLSLAAAFVIGIRFILRLNLEKR